VRLAPIELHPVDPEWSEDVAVPLPLTFYGSYVNPNDPSTAVLPVRLGDRVGELRYSIRNGLSYGRWTCVWEED
jgi:hypothetical protein